MYSYSGLQNTRVIRDSKRRIPTVHPRTQVLPETVNSGLQYTSVIRDSKHCFRAVHSRTQLFASPCLSQSLSTSRVLSSELEQSVQEGVYAERHDDRYSGRVPLKNISRNKKRKKKKASLLKVIGLCLIDNGLWHKRANRDNYAASI